MSLLLPNGQPVPQAPPGQILLEALARNSLFSLQRELQPFLDNKYYSVLGLPEPVGSTVRIGLPGDTELPVVLGFGINVRLPIPDPQLLFNVPEARTAMADRLATAFMEVLVTSPGADHEVIVMRPIPTTYCGPMMVQGATDKLAASFSLGVDQESMMQWFRLDINVGFGAKLSLVKN